MALTQRDTCVITALSELGLGVGISNSSPITIEVPYTIPGEVVLYEQHSYRNKLSTTLSKVIQASSHRAVPPCKYFGNCGGCSLQHLDSNYYNHHKLDILYKVLADHRIVTTILPMRSIGPAMRRRGVFEAVKKHDQIFLGFKKFRSDKIVNIDNCIVLLPELSNLILWLKQFLLEIMSDREKCHIFFTKADNGIDITIERNNVKEEDGHYQSKIGSIIIPNNVIKITIVQNSRWNVIHLSCEPYIIFDDTQVLINNYSFLQVSSLTDKILAEIINDTLNFNIKPGTDVVIVDLFCGRGTLTIPASKFGITHGFESDKSAVKALANANKNLHIFERDLFLNPLKWDELNKYNIAIINPPRAGAEAQCKELWRSGVEIIIYLSCNPKTFVRDAQIIMNNNNYQLREITPIDQFYWSHHLEIMAIFVKSSQET